MRLASASALGLLAGCAYAPHRPPPSWMEPGPIGLGHRGGLELAPENTMPAFEVAAELGLGFELDTFLCATGELVVIHDETLDRTTDGTGRVIDTPLETIRSLDAGSWFGEEWAGTQVPLLDEVLEAFGGQVPIDIEIKSVDGADRATTAAAVVDRVRAHGLEEEVVISSFDPFLLGEVARLAPEIPRAQISGTFADSDIPGWQKLLLGNFVFNGTSMPDFLVVEDAMITDARLRRWKRRGYRVLVWTVNDPDRATQLFEDGVDGVITDRPDLIQPLLPAR